MRSCYRSNLQQPEWEDVTPASRPTGHLPAHTDSNSWETLTQETRAFTGKPSNCKRPLRPHLPEISQLMLPWYKNNLHPLTLHIYCTRCILIPCYHSHLTTEYACVRALLFAHANQSSSTTAIKGTRGAAALWHWTGWGEWNLQHTQTRHICVNLQEG